MRSLFSFLEIFLDFFGGFTGSTRVESQVNDGFFGFYQVLSSF